MLQKLETQGISGRINLNMDKSPSCGPLSRVGNCSLLIISPSSHGFEMTDGNPRSIL